MTTFTRLLFYKPSLTHTHSGCQTQEKVVAASAKTFVVIADYRYSLVFSSLAQYNSLRFKHTASSLHFSEKRFVMQTLRAYTDVTTVVLYCNLVVAERSAN